MTPVGEDAAGVQHEKAVPEGVRRSNRKGNTEKEKGNSKARESEEYCGKHQTHDYQQWQMRGRGQKLSQLTREPETQMVQVSPITFH